MKRKLGKRTLELHSLLKKQRGMAEEELKDASQDFYPTVTELVITFEDEIPSMLRDCHSLRKLRLETDKTRLNCKTLIGLNQLRDLELIAPNLKNADDFFEYVRLDRIVMDCPMLRRFPPMPNGLPAYLEVRGGFKSVPTGLGRRPIQRVKISSTNPRFLVQNLGYGNSQSIETGQERNVYELYIGNQKRDFFDLFHHDPGRFLLCEPSREHKTEFCEDAEGRCVFFTDLPLAPNNFIQVMELMMGGIFVQMDSWNAQPDHWLLYTSFYRLLQRNSNFLEPCLELCDHENWNRASKSEIRQAILRTPLSSGIKRVFEALLKNCD